MKGNGKPGLGFLKELYPFLAPYKLRIAAAGLALITTAAITLSVGQGLRLLVDEGFATRSPDDLAFYVLIFLGLAVGLGVGTFVRYYLVSWLGERVTADMRRKVFDRLLHLHPGFFETNYSGEVQSRITTDTEVLQTLIGSSISFALRNVLMFIGGFIWLFITNPKLTLIILAVVPVVLGPIFYFGTKVRKLSRQTQDRIADVGTFVGELLRNIKAVQAFNRQDRDSERFGNHVETAFHTARKRITQRGLLMSTVIVLVLAAVGLMLYVGGLDVISGAISVGELAAFIFYAFILATSIGAVSGVIGDIQRAAGATERIIQLMLTETELPVEKNPQPLPKKLGEVISFRDVTFAYPGRPDRTVLHGINLTVPVGKKIALVGPSGAGKTTIFDLLLRFYDPTGGEISIDGVPIRKTHPNDLRSRIGLVPQQPALFTGNVLDNIGYADPKASRDDIVRAAEVAYAHHFIGALPDGYETDLGESGVRLSGGQRQRVAIARAVLRNPEILLLDEATSALDAESNYQIQLALNRLLENRTALIIAHRLSTVQNADEIIVLDEGRIIAKGSHTELMETNDLYSRLVRLELEPDSTSK